MSVDPKSDEMPSRTHSFSIFENEDTPPIPSLQPGKERKPISRVLYDRVHMLDDHTCVYCGLRKAGQTLDHYIPFSLGGPDVEQNLVVACLECNQKKQNFAPYEVGMVARYGRFASVQTTHTMSPTLHVLTSIIDAPKATASTPTGQPTINPPAKPKATAPQSAPHLLHTVLKQKPAAKGSGRKTSSTVLQAPRLLHPPHVAAPQPASSHVDVDKDLPSHIPVAITDIDALQRWLPSQGFARIEPKSSEIARFINSAKSLVIITVKGVQVAGKNRAAARDLLLAWERKKQR